MGQAGEVEQGRDSGFQRPADLTLNCRAWSSEWHHVLTVTAAAKNCMFALVCHASLHVDECMHRDGVNSCVHLHLIGLVKAHSHICVCVCVCCSGATGRIYMTSEAGSYYQYPLTCVYFAVHLHMCLCVCELCVYAVYAVGR